MWHQLVHKLQNCSYVGVILAFVTCSVFCAWQEEIWQAEWQIRGSRGSTVMLPISEHKGTNATWATLVIWPSHSRTRLPAIVNNKDNLLPGDRFPTVADEVASFTYWLIRDRQSEPIQGELPSYARFHLHLPRADDPLSQVIVWGFYRWSQGRINKCGGPVRKNVWGPPPPHIPSSRGSKVKWSIHLTWINDPRPFFPFP